MVAVCLASVDHGFAAILPGKVVAVGSGRFAMAQGSATRRWFGFFGFGLLLILRDVSLDSQKYIMRQKG
jgi:hypothetical protein